MCFVLYGKVFRGQYVMYGMEGKGPICFMLYDKVRGIIQ